MHRFGFLKSLAVALLTLGSHCIANPLTKRCNETRGLTQLTHFGERPAYSPDGSKLAFMSKSYGDAFEYDLETGEVRLITHYKHEGYLRVQYLPNGDLFLIGSRTYENRSYTRDVTQEMWILKPEASEAIPLNHTIFEGVAISTKANKIAWANTHHQYPDEIAQNESVIYTANIDYVDGVPTLTDKKEVVREFYPYLLEPQDFYNNDQELTYNCYLVENPTPETTRIYGTEIRSINLSTNNTTVYRARPRGEFNEVEGIFPNSPYTLVESNYQQPDTGAINDRIEIWKMRLEPNTTDFTRLTWFTPTDAEYGFKANNPVVSPDGRTMALQQARARTEAGIGYGIFLVDLERAARHY